ncbi:L-threonylcarbamoyladenylate synthase [Asanoa sp. WMMD1127]|uniref:L-threonylcarbamoyladenylate synthase n=1 Tax=Asanoa sp. WMMD1127 TaxID=3016107 RepID=UPI002417290D|nr:L-threonylcarbamoyladenylate synthase [Asanoa sp. WMMD1127]MDG4823313.1 L-threonylcarbamoyladenylate synthase [Asanoa sp. WMMD1127]
MVNARWLTPGSPSGLLRLGDAEDVAAVLAGGGLAVLPTETGYMLAGAATIEAAVLRVFKAKQRDLNHPMHIACASLEMAAHYGVLTPEARRVIGAFTPGPLTVVVEQTSELPDKLVTHQGTVGIRVPDHPATLQVIAAAGVPVTATSLNPSGAESRPVDADVLASLEWEAGEQVPVVVDHTSIRHTLASTLVTLTGPDGPRVLREGPVSATQVREVLGR